ncbi:MAG: FadR family transcriptional regulator, partial [Xanthomonas perforans]|nr:FadR family transcriptional regulator [Xanthomonas perforans]
MVDDDLARLREQVDRVGRTSDRRLPPETRLCAELGISRSR